MTEDKILEINKMLKYTSEEVAKGNLNVNISGNADAGTNQVANHLSVIMATIKKRISELEEAERKYHYLYDKSLDMCRVVNANSVILECNESYCQKLGYARDEVISKSIFDHYTPESIQAHKQMVEDWIKYKKVFNRELWMKRKDGTTFPILLSSVPIYDLEGKMIASNTIIKDITEIYEARKKIQENEAQIRRQLEELKQVDEMKSQFAAMVTHELKTPFVPIKGYCQMLRKPGFIGELNEDQKEAVEGIWQNTLRLESLIADVLDAQKLEMHKMKFNLEELDVDGFMTMVYTDMASMMADKQLQFVNTTTDKSKMKTDKNRLYQVLRNLIANAVDFVPEKGRIEVGAQGSGDEISIYVKDNGVGIPKEKQENLFKKFYQIDTSMKRKHGGTGLGLSISKGIVEGLGGKIWLESEVGKGTTFFITLPRISNPPPSQVMNPVPNQPAG